MAVGGAPGAPIGQAELARSVAGAARVLDVGCGSGRLTVALAVEGAAVTGIDVSREQLARARARAERVPVDLRLLAADIDAPLAFPDASFDAATSRLALMAASDPVATLRELVRVLAPDGRIATAVWAPVRENPWFGVPRAAVAAALGPERAAFAGAFGRLGDVDQAADAHRRAGVRAVRSSHIVEQLDVADASDHWAVLVRDNGHFRRVDASLGADERAALVEELERRLSPYATLGPIRLARTLVLVTGRAPVTG